MCKGPGTKGARREQGGKQTSRTGTRDEVSGTEGRTTGLPGSYHMAGREHGNDGMGLPWSRPPRYHLHSATRARACQTQEASTASELTRARETDPLDSSMLSTRINLPRIWFSSLINKEVEEYSPLPHGNIRLFKRKYYY